MRPGHRPLTSRLIVESQLPPTIVAIAFLVTFFTKPLSSTPYVFMAAPKVYVVCLLAVLNRKAKLRRHLESSQEWKVSIGVEHDMLDGARSRVELRRSLRPAARRVSEDSRRRLIRTRM